MQEDETPDNPNRLFSNRAFLSLFLGQGVSYFGDSFASIAIPLLIIATTGSGFLMGIVGMLEQAPLFVIGIFAGILVDRWNRRRTMFLADLGRAALMASVPAAVWLHVPLVPVVCIAAIFGGTLSVFFGAAYAGIIPAIVPRKLIGRANGYFEAVESAAYLFGPILAGVLTAKMGAASTLLIDAASFLVSAIAIGFLKPVKGEESVESGPPRGNTPRDFLGELREGLAEVVKSPILKSIVVLWGLNRFLFSSLIPVLTFFVTKTLHEGSTMVGEVVGVYAAGSLGGTLAASWLFQSTRRWISLAAHALMATGALVASLGSHSPGLMAGALLLGLGEGILLVEYLTVRATQSAPELLGRVYSITSTATQGAGAVGFLAIGGLLGFFGGRATLMLIFALGLFSIVPVLITRRRASASG